MTLKRYAVFGVVLFALCVINTFLVGPVYAETTITVDTFVDAVDTNGDCSLREAIIAADSDTAVDSCLAGSGNDMIVLATGIYTLALPGQAEQAALTGDLDISAPQGLTIQGVDVVSTTIDAGGLDRIFDVINPLSQVTIANVTLQNGRVITPESSGGIHNLGILTLTQTIVQNNVVVGETSDSIGGAICNGCGAGTGTLTILDSIIRENSAERGGGIFSNDVMTITNSSVISNSARAGGGIVNYASSGGRITMVNSTISGNVAEGNAAGISQNAGTFTITNSTIANNRASSGGGISYADGTIILLNTLVAGNEGDNCVGAGLLVSNGYNLSSDATCPFTATGDLIETDALLMPLGEGGGILPTHQLSFRSPAIDAATDSQCPRADQNGTLRPQGVKCDIGAVEYSGIPLFLYSPTIRK